MLRMVAKMSSLTFERKESAPNLGCWPMHKAMSILRTGAARWTACAITLAAAFFRLVLLIWILGPPPGNEKQSSRCEFLSMCRRFNLWLSLMYCHRPSHACQMFQLQTSTNEREANIPGSRGSFQAWIPLPRQW